MQTRTRIALTAGLAVLTATSGSGAVLAQDDPAPAQPIGVGAFGNAFTGGLAFKPKDVTAKVGQVVRWTNMDGVVPHTSSEINGLWDLTGSYGATPASPPGYAPGASVQRVFEAGTHAYICRVHPADMRGVVRVPVNLSVTRKRVGKKRHRRTVSYATATWAAAAPAKGQSFDVRRMRAGGDWETFITNTTDTTVTFALDRGVTVEHVEARLRRADDGKAATDWSPDATIGA